MKSVENQPTVAQSARRRLVRGAFAAPAVLTVYSGSAAASGSVLRCLVNQTGTPIIPAVKDSVDSYLRVQLKRNGTSPNFNYWVCGADLQVYKRPGTSVYLASNKWQPFNISTNIAGAETATAPSNYSNSGKYAAVRFDASGNVKGVGIGQAGQSALSQSCWNSVAVAL